MTVSIIKTNFKNIDRDIKKLLDLINYKPKKKKILIKPNIAYGTSIKSGKITHPRVVEALIKYFKPISEEIIIGEGSAVGHDTMKSFKIAGYNRLAEKYGIKLVDFNDCKRFKIKWKYGYLSLPELIKTHEYINVPTMKTHTLTIVTLGIKNQKGLLLPEQKKFFHTIDLEDGILNLGKVVKPDLTVVNGIYCLEGNSLNIINKAKKLNLILAGKDIVEVDNICIEIMGIDKTKVRHVPKLDNIKTVGINPKEIECKFKAASKYRKLLNGEFWLKGCSGCSVSTECAIKLMMKRPIKAFKFFLKLLFKRPLYISGCKIYCKIKGKQPYFIGNCTHKIAKELGYKNLPGCPPKPKEILKVLSD